MYFSRVTRLFEDAEVSWPEMEQLINGCVNEESYAEDWSPSSNTPALKRLKHDWEDFVQQVTQEWKTLNVVSALLLSAILTMFQINDAATQVITHTASLFSLVCALWSLIYGCTYILRFSSMRSMYRASHWAQEAHNSEAYILWNVWVLLALPAVWLAWSVIAFLTAILAFVWTSGSSSDNPTPPGQKIEWILRAMITVVFLLGAVYFCFVVRTFSSYGSLRPSRRRAGVEQEDPRNASNAIPGRGIASPRSTPGLVPHSSLPTPDDSARQLHLHLCPSTTASPGTADLLLASPGIWRMEARGINDSES